MAFYIQGSSTSVFFTSDGVTFSLTSQQQIETGARSGPRATEETTSERWVVKLDFVGADSEARPEGQHRTSAVVSYFKGQRPDWKTGLPTYGGLVYRDLWPGIDLVYTGTGGRLKYTFVVQPGADSNQIQLMYRGATDVRVTEEGRLAVSTLVGGFEDDTPYAYQDVEGNRAEVPVAYTLPADGGTGAYRYGFRLGAYDKTKPLILDPVQLIYCGYIGGSGDDSGNGIAVDSSGNVYITGDTSSTEATFPETVGPDLFYNGGTKDVFVAKVNASGTALIYSGYIGGSGEDIGRGIAVDASGNAYITGDTSSTEATFPVTVGPFLSYNGGGTDVFVAKVDATGTSLNYSGYIGGTGEEQGNGIAVDSTGSAYITGQTNSRQNSFPETVGPDLSYNGNPDDAFVAKVNSGGTALTYCGYIGGSSSESGNAIAVDTSGNAYITGSTISDEGTFPVTVGPDLTYNGGTDVFLAKVDPTGTALTYCGYIGGSLLDVAYGIAVDTSGNAYITGYTSSDEGTFPETVGPDLTQNGSLDAFVAKVNAGGTALDYCGYIGGLGDDIAYGIAVDASGNAYVVGETFSTETTFPVTRGPDLTFNGFPNDAFVAKVIATGSGLTYCGYVGGSGDEQGNGIAVDSSGNAYITGMTGSTEPTFPELVGPGLTYGGGTTDAFVAKIEDTGGTVDSNIRSIGSYSTGDASVPQFGSTVTFGSGASLPAWVQSGDRLTLDPGGGNQEVFTVSTVDTATQVTVTVPASQDHLTPESYHIGWVYNTGDATIPLGGTTVTFGSGASLPARVGAGDELVIGGETFHVASRVSATEVIVQTAATINHAPPEAYSLERAYKLLQDWETDRQGDLVALDRLEVGVAYNDGPFTTGATINGSTTDATQYLYLTVAPGHRHTGIAGTGVVLDGGDTDQGLRLSDDYTVVEWFEFTRNRGSAGAAGLVVQNASNVLIQQVIIHDFFDLGNLVTGIRAQSNADYAVRNCIIYDGGRAGIRNNDASATGLVENCTIYGMVDGGTGAGLMQSSGTLTVTNTISMGNEVDFSGAITQSYNMSEDATANCGATCRPSEDPNLQFVNIAAGDEANWDLHLKAGATAIDIGTDLSAFFSDDIDLQQRPSGIEWDMGADEQLTTLSCPVSEPSWFDNDWASRKAIVVDSTKVTGVVTDFPVLINLPSDAELAADAQDDGDDILFTASDGKTKLSHEIEKFCGGIITAACPADTGEFVAWVKVPYVSSGANTAIYMYYGNGTVGSQEDVVNTWGSNFKGVWHLKEDPSGTAPQATDSTQFNNHGSSNGSMTTTDQVAGKMGGSWDFDGVPTAADADYIDQGTDASLDMGAGDFTLETWFKTSASGEDMYLAGKGMAGPGGKRYMLMIRAGAPCSNGFVRATIDDDVTGGASFCSASAYNDGFWHHAAEVRDGNNLRLYLDGSEVITSPVDITGVLSLDDPRPFTSGILWDSGSPNHVAAMIGQLDEIRISSTARSAAWLETQHNNQNDPANFYLVCSATTAVELTSFTATGLDREVLLNWETGSEIKNLGFHLYRSTSEEGPYGRITASVIPGLGSSPEGAKYAHRDSGLVNGVTYYYKLEDIETTGATELHGPASATPTAEVVLESGSGGEEEVPDDKDLGELSSRIMYGDPSANELKVRRRGRRWMELELITEGFYAIPQDDGSVLLEVPGFEDFGGPDLPDVPVYRTWQDVLAGRNVRLASVNVNRVAEFTSLRPSSSELIVVASGDGTVQTGRRRKKRRKPPHVYYPESWAQLMSVGFQGAAKKALVEMAPLRWDATAERLVLARRLVVRISFKGKDKAEVKLGKSHREVGSHANRSVYARIAVTEPGLYAVSYESIFRNRKKAIKTKNLRLSRQGEPVAFFVSPNRKKFKKKSKLYFLSDGASLNPYGHQAIYELESSTAGVQMGGVDGSPAGAPTSFYWKTVNREENLLYQAAFEGEEDLWQWDWLFGPMTNGYPFEVTNLASVPESSKLRVWLHGASDFPEDPDHHVRFYINGILLDETWWDGETPHFVEVELGTGLLQEGENTLEIEEVGDTEAQYSMVMLDRFEVSYPAQLIADEGKLEGSFSQSGVANMVSPPAEIFDVTDAEPRRLTGVGAVQDELSFRVESGHHYLSTSLVKAPEVRLGQSTGLKKAWSRAEYLVIGPREFLPAAEPLLAHRRNEGLIAGAIATEDIYDEFGYGEATPESVRDFLSYVYHHWSEPTLRYVVLLGDGTYDTKDYLATGVKSQVPVKIVKTRYMWTASDPWYGAINGDDILPDVAIGRLPAASVGEVQVLVQKILAYESGEGAPEAPFVLITDNPDLAGNFDADAEEIASTVLKDEGLEKIYLSQLGSSGARGAILNAFDQGASMMSYMGHGAIHLWANENLFDIWQVDSLSSQEQQPLLLTMNCLNGYFHFPYFNSLSEELLKAEGKGIIAAFSPTGLSLNDPAHRFHMALLEQLVNQGHARLGDAVLAGQAAYAGTGAFPELLSIYHLLGDPALRLR